MKSVDYTRDDLIAICERAVVPHERWNDRDTDSAQQGVGKAWVYLRAGCDFRIIHHDDDDLCVTSDRTIWVEITHDNFGVIDWGGPQETDLFYLPTPARLDATTGRDWY